MVLEGGGRLSAICIEYVCILHIKGPVALEQASFGRKAEEAQHQTGSGKRRICHRMSCFVEQLSFQNKENEEAADGIMRWGRGGWRAEWIGLLEQHGRGREGEREVPVLVAWRPFWPI